MSTLNSNPVAKAVRYALIAGAATVAMPAVFAESEDGAEENKVQITGSRIKRTDVETASPITVISREDLDISGDTSIADALRQMTFNSFGSYRDRSGSGNGATGNALVSLRGLGANRTLVLLDGRRISGSPSFGGSSQNLNLIPFAAVERVEVLRDGASAVYGSDAIAGVINIILRKDFDGVQLIAGANRPTESGADEDTMSFTMGVASDKGSLTFSWEHYDREMLFNTDRTFTANGFSSFGFPGTYRASSNALDANGGLVQVRDPETGNFQYLDANGNLTDVNTGTPAYHDITLSFADSRCPATLGSSAEYPNSFVGQSGFFGGEACLFNYAATSAHSAAVKRDSVFIDGDYEINEDISLFNRTIVSRVKSFGRYAPAPRVGGTPFLPTMAANNPNNPLLNNPNVNGPAYGYSQNDDGLWIFGPIDGVSVNYAPANPGGFSLDIGYRNVPGGTRDSNVTDDNISQVIGVQGTTDSFDWELAMTYNRAVNLDLGSGYGFSTLLQNAIDDGSFDIFGVNGVTDASVAQSFGHMTVFRSEVKSHGADGNITFDIADTDAGTIAALVGFEYEDVVFEQVNDPQSNSGNVFGTSGGDNVVGFRERFSLFSEAIIPVTDVLELSAALRWDKYEDFGTTVNPKIGAAYRPADGLLIRASYGEGFRAPDMTELYGSQSQSFDDAVDSSRCIAAQVVDSNGELLAGGRDTTGDGQPDEFFDGDDDGTPDTLICRTTQYQTFSGGNPDLDAEESESMSFGVVWQPMEDLSLSFDYYDIEFTNQVATLTAQRMFNREQLGQSHTVVRDGSGAQTVTRTNQQNLSGVMTNGFDFDVAYNMSTEFGAYKFSGQFTKVLNFEQEVAPGDGFENLEGQVTAANGARPDFRYTLGAQWSLGDMGASLFMRYIDEAQDGTNTLDSWRTFDIQFTYNTPWDGQIAVGATNLTNEEPPQSATFGHPFYDSEVHDIFGRVPYVRYTQNF
ncbi:TonB-dependent siderophore receptor [Pleionea sp. CnH1-48]|uniref:TonB-dependent receptor plug domain-containing protein n=1 Tax=Pleionea sp. CnH1-48 TaxID=2954494 RepID=UPI0020978FBA|nr:TonB-dependent receptor [Pleionea sp. CnH1-48]MCO7225025.1 TonB-dependent receptor [Pleionea sp. CnH1-48]